MVAAMIAVQTGVAARVNARRQFARLAAAHVVAFWPVGIGQSGHELVDIRDPPLLHLDLVPLGRASSVGCGCYGNNAAEMPFRLSRNRPNCGLAGTIAMCSRE